MTNITQIIEEFKKEFPHSEPYTKFMADFIRQKLEDLINSVPDKELNRSSELLSDLVSGYNDHCDEISDWKQSAKK